MERLKMRGDSLARGARSATFGPVAKVSQSKWDAAFEDFDPETFRNKETAETDPDAEKAKVKVGI
jgi:hypothetical protein